MHNLQQLDIGCVLANLVINLGGADELCEDQERTSWQKRRRIMRARHRACGSTFAIPKLDLEKDKVEKFMERLKGFHGEFENCFQRSEARQHFFQYMLGQFSKLEKKSAGPIAAGIRGGSIRGLQRFLSDVHWDEDRMLSKYHRMITDDMGDENGVLIFAEHGFPKKGADSAGVARQHCSNLGKVDNCQVGVFSGYVSRHGCALLDKRLFMPQKWFGEEYKERRKKCELPKKLEFKTKSQLAVEMFRRTEEEATIPFKYVVADTPYGNSPEFVKAMEDSHRSIYFLPIASNTSCWLKEPFVTEKEYTYNGKRGAKPIRVDNLAQNINQYFWYRVKVSEGKKAPTEYEITKREVVLSAEGLPEREVWLIVKRTLDISPAYSYYISNAARSTRLKTFVWLSEIHWAMERCFEETRTELGIDQYEVRKYAGWNHHILSCMLAHFFLWHLQISSDIKNSIYCPIAV